MGAGQVRFKCKAQKFTRFFVPLIFCIFEKLSRFSHFTKFKKPLVENPLNKNGDNAMKQISERAVESVRYSIYRFLLC